MVTVVICEKPSQARNLRVALGGKFGEILAARGHLLELAEPQEVRDEWARWSDELLHPGGPYPLKPARGKEGVLNRIRVALRDADEVIVATDMGREGHLIGMEIVEHLRFRGRVRRANFSAEDPETIRSAFGCLTEASDHAGLLAAGKARQQADQICNLTLTRAVTVRLAGRGQGAIGVGRVRTPTLAIVCRREQEITGFTPQTRWAVLADIAAEGGTFTAACTRAPGSDGPLTDRGAAEAIAGAAQGWTGSIGRTSKPGRRGPPAPHDLAALQADAGRQLKWTAKRTLDTAQQLYSELKLITYPRVDARVWPEAMAADAAALRRAVCAILMPDREPGEATVRTGGGRDRQFSDRRLEGHEHHAIAPNAAAAGDFPRLWQSCTDDQRSLAAILFRRYAATTSPDWTFTTTALSLGIGTPDGPAEFTASGTVIGNPGWTEWERPPPDGPKDGDGAEDNPNGLPKVADGERGRCTCARTDERRTRPPARYAEGSIITAMKEAWKFLPEGLQRDRLKEAGGIGTPATRDQVIETLVRQGQIAREKGRFRPTEAGLALWRTLERRAPATVDPGTTAAWEAEFDRLAGGDGSGWMELVDRLAQETARAVGGIGTEPEGSLDGLDRGAAAQVRRRGRAKAGQGPASERQIALLRKLATERGEPADEGRLASMSAAQASERIESLMPAGRTNVGGGGTGTATRKQLDFIRRLSAQRGVAIDEAKLEAMGTGEASAEIERLKAIGRPGGEASQGGDMTPSPARLKYAEDLAARNGAELPEDCRTDWRKTKAFIDRWSRK